MEIHDLGLPPMPACASDMRDWAQECLRSLDGELEPLKARIHALEADRDFFARLRDMALDGDGSGSDAPVAQAAPTDLSQGGVSSDIDLTQLTVDLDGAQSMAEKVVRIAKAAPPGTLLNVTELARALIRLGGTMATLHNARVSAKRALNGQPDRFELIRKATYKYTGGTQSADLDHNPDGPGPGDLGHGY